MTSDTKWLPEGLGNLSWLCIGLSVNGSPYWAFAAMGVCVIKLLVIRRSVR